MSNEEETTFGKIKNILLMVLLLAGGLWFAYLAFNNWRVSQAIANSGEEVQGMVVDARTTRSRRSRSHYLEVDYTTKAGQEINAEFSTPRSFFESHPVGAPVEVGYLPDDPQTSILVGGEKSDWIFYIIAPIMILIGLFGLISGIISAVKPSDAATYTAEDDDIGPIQQA